MENFEVYESPEMEIFPVEDDDVIVASNPVGGGNEDSDPFDTDEFGIIKPINLK